MGEESTQEKRNFLAIKAGLIDHGWKYNYPSEDIPDYGRFFCRKDKWKPDEDWNQMMYLHKKIYPNRVEHCVFMNLELEFNNIYYKLKNKCQA